jgi:hypothetical protein
MPGTEETTTEITVGTTAETTAENTREMLGREKETTDPIITSRNLRAERLRIDT